MKGVQVPDDISVIGFDDSQDAFSGNLSSYNFDFEQAAYRMLNFVLNPKDSQEPKKRVVEVDGMVIARATTGQAPKRRE
jgi:DNA-binding LacI/PurR family transcriptional regulator